MGIRITEISTPFGGLAWEYTDRKDMPTIPSLEAGRKINVFVSSKCGDKDKYDHVRSELKKAIEATNIADVYLFEDEGASSVPAGLHYEYALEDCDVCIFLIDNADGIPTGVQKEIDIVKKHEIKSLCYFCDEHSCEKTVFEQSMMGAKYAKSYAVHRFDDLIQNCAQNLIDEIVAIYHHYCRGRLDWRNDEPNAELQPVSIVEIEKSILPIIPKTVIQNVDRCKEYFLKLVLGYTPARFPDETENTCDIDDWCAQFLPVLFEGKSIKQFNTGMFLDTLKGVQTSAHFQIVQSRWNAIQYYFMGDLDKCIDQLWMAKKIATETEQPLWVIKDILIDLRNLHWKWCTANNCFTESTAQKELSDSDQEVFYPLLDRVNESLQEKYISGLYKKKVQSPYTVTLGGDLDQYGALIASSYTIAMYNGSLTHILMLFDKLRDFTFYLTCKYSDWNLRRDLLKFAVYAGKEKDIIGIRDSYPEILNELSADDASIIMSFGNNHPIEYERFISQLCGFGTVGYYLSDQEYKKYEVILLNKINAWLNDEHAIVQLGGNIFKSLMGIAYRISQDILAEICISFIKKHYSRWYLDMFKFIRDRIDIRKMKKSIAQDFLEQIILILRNEQDCDLIKRDPMFLCILRKQDYSLTQELDQAIAESLPQFYHDSYKLETTEAPQDLPPFIQKYVASINSDNQRQGKDGGYFERGTRNAATIRSILRWNNVDLAPHLADSIVNAAANTLLLSKESVRTKLDAVSLLICIIFKYPTDYERNKVIYQKVYEQRETIESDDDALIAYNINGISLKIALCFLFTAMDIDIYSDMLMLISYIQDDIPTTIAIAHLIEEYIEISNDITLPDKIDSIVLQNVLRWLQSDNLDVRCIAARILLPLLRNPENKNTVNRQIIHLMDSECVFIKNYIMRRVYELNGIREETKNYVISKCENDPCYVVRMVCAEQKNIHARMVLPETID